MGRILGCGGDFSGYRHDLRRTSPYAGFMAAISALMPMMLMTRLML